ncbi:sulfur carrier protein [Desulfocicer vacuolatum DSM 3385]|uniref:Sulfur carrier protein n=1 Tax=Desulfocicer vacuolatum DSM 3385 TaxID=1121400 RepID=A0A1W2C0R4_9BACT|nr:sulfur carrier protein ThiS [Desulfocicer vacuolatum]SMC78773.1 sulfur carrier protein [Desulfocicer vacuolatum DSM 3385]
MEIQLNGKLITTSAPNVMALVKARGLDPGSVIIEYNKNVIKQDVWDKTPVRPGDILELLSFVGGG